ncbi:hypothetical protein CXIVA_11180 [Clostridium sp. SY8519]|jgi:4-methyl-5(b-hydroxyethyl)-thiazole monophosphate biosynthesis|uniref:DJ-1/PfpI family protein n=1 Tax=Clostridium sp. (strain SY8519) TaxID=1042156 RepID=UPI0002171C5E|nr:DJ-1/PfpI family protein [Clostridium sp. SY8519]BAK47085.1 hypothetical protein CXIVA_11180 [Clostridium sp. SY8519]
MKLAVLCADNVEEIECLTVVDYCRRANLAIDMLSVMERRMVTGAHGITFQTDGMWTDADPEEYDALILPGGSGYVHLRENPSVCDAIVNFWKEKKLVAAICASPSIFAELGILKGKDAVVYPGMEVVDAGVNWLDQSVAVSGNVITGKGPSRAGVFAIAVIRYVAGDAAAEAVKAEVLSIHG